MGARGPIFGRYRFVLLVAAVCTAVPSWSAGAWLSVGPAGAVAVSEGGPQAPRVTVEGCDQAGLTVTVEFAGLSFEPYETAAGQFVRLSAPEAAFGGEVGQPALPVVRRLFVAPPEATVALGVEAGSNSAVELADFGFDVPIVPRQAAISMAPGALEQAEFALQAESYAAEGFAPTERATVTELGLVRGWRLHLLEVRPLAYDPTVGRLSVWPRIEVSISFAGGQAIESDLPRSVGRVVLNPPASQASGRDTGDYRVVVGEALRYTTAMTDFIAAKTAQGFTVGVDVVTAGMTKEAIKSGIWRGINPPEYILLVGDNDTIPHWMGLGDAESPTDLYYACGDGPDDWYPDTVVGRFSVRTEGELEALVDKTLYVSGGAYSDPGYLQRAAFLAGVNGDWQGGEDAHEYAIDTYLTPAGFECAELFARLGATTEDVRAAFNNGCLLGSFYGHSVGDQWSDGPPFTEEDVQGLLNYHRYPILFNYTCKVANFASSTYEPCFGETWTRVSNKGAVVFWGPTDYIYYGVYMWPETNNLAKWVFDAIYDDGLREVGPATQSAQYEVLATYGAADPVSRDYMEMFVVLGDPGLAVPVPHPANYLIIVPDDYASSAPLTQFISHRAAQGYNVLIYQVPPGTSNSTIKAYIQGLWGTEQAPQYILIVGDTSGYSSTSSTIPHWQGGGDKGADTDLPYACMDAGDDWYPEIAIGRFSVSSVSELQAVVDKTIKVESGNFTDPDYVKRGAFLANPSTYGQAEPTHDWVIDTYFVPNDYEGIKLYSAEGAGTQDVMDAVNSGCLFTLYFGHSTSSGWWDPAFDQGDVAALSNDGLYGIAFGWSCNTAHFSYGECCGETWIREANKGAAAYISASDYIYWGSVSAWEPSVVSEKSFFTAIFADDIWQVGPAWQAGMYRFLKDYGGWDGDPSHSPPQHADICRNFMEEFVLLGDPALRLPKPNGFALDPTPSGYDLCCPPDDQAQYTINVDQLGTFSEVVTLNLSGQPAGATVDFSVNSQSPPFTSVLTVGNLIGAAAGDYNLVITGTSASMQRSTNVSLGISAGAPAGVTLTSPPDGATDVDLKPELVWEDAPDADEYDLEIATDPGFSNVVYSATVSQASHTVDTPLGMLSQYYWHVRTVNACGQSSFSSAFNFTTVNKLMPVSYDMLNGESGSYTYYDDTYDGDGDTGTPLAPLSNGLGDLTDGVIATEHWNVTSGPYVGWHTIEPTITFHFAESINLEAVTLHVDDTGGGGGVVPPTDIVLDMGGVVLSFPVTDPSGFAPFAFTCADLGMTGDTLAVTLEDSGFTTSRYMMLSEVEFTGTANTGACCQGESCTTTTEDECLLVSGTYHGDGTDCAPNPCLEYESSCVIISEVVDATLSGGCPKFIEITNTGLSDFAFIEGGVIVQMDSDSDVVVDVDLSGVTIGAGDSLVINSNHGGECSGAFPAIFGFPADLNADCLFGDGDDRYILTDTADGSNLLDIYGEFGVDGTGSAWEYTDGYSYRLPGYNGGSGGTFAAGEWYFGGVDSLETANPEEDLLNFTTPGGHAFEANCYTSFDLDDFALFATCLAGPDVSTPPKGCSSKEFYRCDIQGDNDVDFEDFCLFMEAFAGQ